MGSDWHITEFAKYRPNAVLATQPYSRAALFGGRRGIVFGELEKSFYPAEKLKYREVMK